MNDGEIELLFCPTKNQIADVMTKPVKLDVFEKMRRMLGVRNLEGLN